MLMDALTTTTNLAGPALLTTLAAGTPGYSDVIDLSVSRDLAPAPVPYSVQFVTLPTSGTGGATINVALQTSADNATWVTMEESAPQVLTSLSTLKTFLIRGFMPTNGLRYYRFAYTASAVLTAGAVIAQIGADWPRDPSYPRNFVA